MAEHAHTTTTSAVRRTDPPDGGIQARRGFLALVGASFVSGAILRRAQAAPTLILPASAPLVEVSAAAGHPLLAAEQTQMHAFVHVKGGLPDDLFMDWLESGLRMAKGCRPGGVIHRAMQAEGRA